jgi:hypothetical protein
MEQRILEQLAQQGPVVAVLCFALWWLNQRLNRVEEKADRCEQDRIRLWKRIAHIIPAGDETDEQP